MSTMTQNISSFLIRLMAAALIAVALTACSDTLSGDDGPQGVMSDVTVSITRSDSSVTPDENAEPNELINYYWVVFVNNSTGLIEKIIDRPGYDPNNPNPVQTESFTAKLPSGKYDIYAFANMGNATHILSSNYTDADGEPLNKSYKFEEGEPVPEGVDDAVYTEPIIGDNADVPMTGFIRNITVSAIESNNIAVEVVRLVAKLNFRFYSDASQEITIESVDVLSARTKYVPLFPTYKLLDNYDEKLMEIPADAQLGTLSHSWNNATVMPQTHTKANPLQKHFYVFESKAKEHPTGKYVLQFNVRDKDGKSHKLNALLYQLDHIYRNDLINIPVCITDWNIDLDIRFYPPIGGYPTVVIQSKGDEFYSTFGSSGLFAVKTKVTGYNNEVYGHSQYTCKVTDIYDPNKILTRMDTVPDSSGELVGEIGIGSSGTAVLTLKFQVAVDQLEHIFERKLHIINQ